VTKVENHSNVKFVQEQQNNENREVNNENYCVQTLSEKFVPDKGY